MTRSDKVLRAYWRYREQVEQLHEQPLTFEQWLHLTGPQIVAILKNGRSINDSKQKSA